MSATPATHTDHEPACCKQPNETEKPCCQKPAMHPQWEKFIYVLEKVVLLALAAFAAYVDPFFSLRSLLLASF